MSDAGVGEQFAEKEKKNNNFPKLIFSSLQWIFIGNSENPF